MKKLLFTIAFLFGLHFLSFGQESNRAVYLELGGNGLAYSLNYEHGVMKSPLDLKLRYGVGYLPIFNSDLIFTPVTLSSLHKLGNKGHHFEIGAGVNTLWAAERGEQSDLDIIMILTSTIGYRYQNNRWMYKVALTPFYSLGTVYNSNGKSDYTNNDGSIRLIGLGVGYRF